MATVKKQTSEAAVTAERKGGGSTLSRSETVTVRLDPKLRYLAELAARSHRRTLSSWIEWSIKTSVDQELLAASEVTAQTEALGDAARFLWDVDEPGRLAQLALHYPSLLTFEEQLIWKLVKTNGYFWRGKRTGPTGEWQWTVKHESLIDYHLEQYWQVLCDVARTGEGHDRLPKWERFKPEVKPAPAEDDDAIPL
jgi:hypothetical protein